MCDRPGEMNKVYENINTGKTGKIIKYEDRYKTLIILGNDKAISITYSTFKKQWREKC